MECTNNYSCRSLLFLLLLISASISQSRQSINEDEERINSEGMWQNRTAMMEPTEASKGEGNSRFGIIPIIITKSPLSNNYLFPVHCSDIFYNRRWRNPNCCRIENGRKPFRPRCLSPCLSIYALDVLRPLHHFHVRRSLSSHPNWKDI